MGYKIGDRVMLVADKHNAYASVVDVLVSKGLGKPLYMIKYDRCSEPEQTLYAEEDLYRDDDVSTLSCEIELAENVVIARLYQNKSNGARKIIAMGHGHIFHEGILGYTQAASYAMRRIYEIYNNNEGANEDE